MLLVGNYDLIVMHTSPRFCSLVVTHFFTGYRGGLGDSLKVLSIYRHSSICDVSARAHAGEDRGCVIKREPLRYRLANK